MLSLKSKKCNLVSKESNFVPFDILHKYFIYTNLFDFRVNETGVIVQMREYTGLGDYRGRKVYTFIHSVPDYSDEIQNTYDYCLEGFKDFISFFLS